jgi:hypothetical protein
MPTMVYGHGSQLIGDHGPQRSVLVSVAPILQAIRPSAARGLMRFRCG